MRERRIAFLARDLVFDDTSGGTLPFSYAARKLEASVRTAPDLGDVESTVIDLRSIDPEEFFERIRAFRPTVIGASTYIWSVKLFCQIAEMVRQWDPSIRFVMGGPAARPSLLSLAPYAPYLSAIDAVVTGEGEEIIRRIVRDAHRADWTATVPGLQVPGPRGWRQTAAIDRPILDDYPSPYHLGTVPQSAVGFLETFRGCPISCAFCQWGEERSDRVHSAHYLTSYLRGLEAAGAERVWIVDAAFNLSARAFRHLVAAEREVGLLSKCQVVGHIYPTFIKEEHLSFFESFGRPEITIGIQSFDKEVLERLGRPVDLARMTRVLGEMRERFDIDLELILGLPGDNPTSFRRSFEQAIELATTVRVFQCLALPDALIERADQFDVDFDPETFKLRSCAGWTQEDLRREWEYVLSVGRNWHRPIVGPDWTNFRLRPAEDVPPPPQPSDPDPGVGAQPEISPEVIERLRAAIAVKEMGWSLADVRTDGDCLLLDLDGAAGSIVLEVTRTRPGQPCFSRHEGLSYSHRDSIPSGSGPLLRNFIEQVHRDVQPVVACIPPSADAVYDGAGADAG